MLKKLLKYDVKSLWKMHGILYATLLVLACLVRIFLALSKEYSLLTVVSSLMVFVFILLVIASFVGTFVIVIVRFYQNLIKDEGYLTHTLPVKTSSLIQSKLISAFIFTTITNVIVILALLLAFYQKGFINDFTAVLEQVSLLYHIPVWGLIIGFIATYLVSNILQILLMYLGIALGQLYTGKKLMYSVVYTILIYTGIQIVTSVVLFGVFSLIPGLWNEMNAEIPSLLFLGTTLGISNVISISLAILFYYMAIRIFTKKLNME